MMQTYRFSICGLQLVLQAELPLNVRGDMLPFYGGAGTPELLIEGRAVPELPEQAGVVCRSDTQCQALRSGQRISRCRTQSLHAAPYACVSYTLEAPGHVLLTVREADWSWATDHLRLWSTLSLPQLLLHVQTLIFHASYIVTGGRAILFTAPSQTGKSTQAGLWQKFRGACVVNGDKAAVTLRGRPLAHGVPFSGTSGICENVSAPLAAIVVLSQAPDNTIRRLGPSQAAAARCPNLFADQAVSEEWALALQGLLDLVASVPVYALACTPDERAVEALERAMDADRQTDEGDA